MKPLTGLREGAGLDFKEARKRFEQEYLRQRLEENNWNISQTAEQIGLERSHLHKKIKSLDIEIEQMMASHKRSKVCERS